MKTIHLANTDFEFELAGVNSNLALELSWQRHPLCLQLQFLPLLYASADEAVAVTHLPDHQFLEALGHLAWRQQESLPILLPLSASTIPYEQCLSWGASKKIEQWAQSKKIHYLIPPWEIVKEINSKAFSFTLSPPLQHSALISNSRELEDWLKDGKIEQRVLKTCFGLSGRGHTFINADTPLETIYRICEKEWSRSLPLIGEPWLDRFLDFSTQWHIGEEIQFIGSTLFEADTRGVYKSTWAGPESILFASYLSHLERHKEIAFSILQKIKQNGFFGYLGIDAFLYRTPQKEIQLRPLVEINGRQTMSLVALQMQKRWFPQNTLHLSFIKQKDCPIALLPTSLHINQQKQIDFHHQLHLSVIN